MHTDTMKVVNQPSQTHHCSSVEESSKSPTETLSSIIIPMSAPTTPNPDWTRLPTDILSHIFSLLPDNSHCIRFRSVCHSWRFASPRRLPFPLILYPPPSRLDEDVLNFFDLVASRYGTVDLPPLRRRQFCGSTLGWLVLRGNGSCPPFPISIFNPFTARLSILPPLTQSPPEKIILTSLPPSPIAAVAILGRDLPLLFCTQQCPFSWAPLQPSSSFHDAVFYNEKLYAVNASRTVFVYDRIVSDTVPDEIIILSNRGVPKGKEKEEKNYLVESFGDLFLVIRSWDIYEHVKMVTTKLEVFKLDLFEKKPKCYRVRSLGDGVLFLGVNTSFALSANNLSRMEPYMNQIYFSYDGFNHLGEMVGRQDGAGCYNVDTNVLVHSLCRTDIPHPVIPPTIYLMLSG